MATFEVVVKREGQWWTIATPELGGVTQARRREDVETAAREYIAVTLDRPFDSFDLTLSPR